MCSIGPQSHWEQLLCAQGSPLATPSTQGLREGTATEMTLEGSEREWPVVIPTALISNAVHGWEIAGCIHHVELRCGGSKEAPLSRPEDAHSVSV